MNPRGEFCPLRTLRASREGILRRPSAPARMGGLRRLMSTNAFRGRAIVLEVPGIRATALYGRSGTLHPASPIIRLSLPRRIPFRVEMF